MLPEPYYADDYATLYLGDCRELLPLLADDLVIITDPPYGINYEPLALDGHASGGHSPIVGDHSFELAALALSTPAAWRVVFGAHEFPHLLAPGGRWFCWDKRLTVEADRIIGSPFELAWSPTHGNNEMLRCLHAGSVNANRIRKEPSPPRQHPTEKAVPMLRELVGLAPPGIVLDPFAGSGTTLRAAKDCGRQSIGIEVEERYCEATVRRLAQGVLDFGGGS